jgi:hypothetical protein
MKRTLLAVVIVAAALCGCTTAEQLEAACRDHAALAGVQPTPEWLAGCTRQHARAHQAQAALN